MVMNLATTLVTCQSGYSMQGVTLDGMKKWSSVMDKAREPMTDPAAAARRARFGKLPRRIRFEDMTEEAEAGRSGGVASCNPEASWTSYSCLALDLGL
ncbi:hypothetical protein [Streptomyces sp. NPDC101165]|uniref:hypothetical protein n=1 Tax=Streptomyces sp. NPDC101165 TaxID=3366119 RepID=UPI003825AE05